MPKFSVTIGFIIFPFPFVFSTIWPNLNPKTFPGLSTPFSFIDCSALESERRSFFYCCAIVIVYYNLVEYAN